MFCINRAANLLQKILIDFNYTGGITIAKDSILVEYEGVRLDTKYTNRYFKAEHVRGSPYVAKDILYLIRKVVKEEFNPKFIIDIGANVGEVSIYLSNKFPKSEVVVVEAHPDNIRGLMRNLDLNNHTIKSKNIVEKAISDNNKGVFFTKRRSSKATIHQFESNNTINVDSITLANLFNQYNNPVVDFLKIDIEGGEILLIDSLKAVIDKIRISLIEMSPHNDKNKQLLIFKLFMNNDFSVYYQSFPDELNRLKNIDDISKILDKNVTIDFLFVDKSLT